MRSRCASRRNTGSGLAVSALLIAAALPVVLLNPLGGCAGLLATGWEWRVRFIKDDRRGTVVPAERPDGTRRYVFGDTSRAGTRDVRLKRGAWFVDVGVDHAYSPDGDCGGLDVRSARFVVR